MRASLPLKDPTHHCYVTDYSQSSFNGSIDHCRGLDGNYSLLVLRTLDHERKFWSYVGDDQQGLLKDRHLWLGAQSQPVDASSSNLDWTWVDGDSSSKYSSSSSRSTSSQTALSWASRSHYHAHTCWTLLPASSVYAMLHASPWPSN